MALNIDLIQLEYDRQQVMIALAQKNSAQWTQRHGTTDARLDQITETHQALADALHALLEPPVFRGRREEDLD